MNTNEPSKLPPIPPVQPSLVEGVIPLPATSLLGEGELITLNRKSPGEPDPAEVKARESAHTEFTTFEDGSFFKYIERKGFAPQCLLVDAAGQQIAVARNVDVAEFLCNACNCFILATIKNDGPLQLLTKPIIIPPQNGN